jgi:hypothetical protein
MYDSLKYEDRSKVFWKFFPAIIILLLLKSSVLRLFYSRLLSRLSFLPFVFYSFHSTFFLLYIRIFLKYMHCFLLYPILTMDSTIVNSGFLLLALQSQSHGPRTSYANRKCTTKHWKQVNTQNSSVYSSGFQTWGRAPGDTRVRQRFPGGIESMKISILIPHSIEILKFV